MMSDGWWVVVLEFLLACLNYQLWIETEDDPDFARPLYCFAAIIWLIAATLHSLENLGVF